VTNVKCGGLAGGEGMKGGCGVVIGEERGWLGAVERIGWGWGR
jgi:hypothetical protein